MMQKQGHVPFLLRLPVRISYITFVLLFLGFGITIGFFFFRQNNTILQSKERAIQQEADILYTAIKNNMLAGEAPIAMNLFRDFTRGNFASDISLFRRDQVPAFSDNETILTVNRNIRRAKFEARDNPAKKAPVADANIGNAAKESRDILLRKTEEAPRYLFVYKPLVNQPRCSACHGTDHAIRGVIRIAAPVDDIFADMRQNTIISVAIYIGIVVLLAFALLVFIRRVVILRVLTIGEVVHDVGQGNFDAKLMVKSRDEIGNLSNQINQMTEGLRERFNLVKFVSKSTLAHVKSRNEVVLGGIRKKLTVLFTDVRGFTDYSESHDPEEVINQLNTIMNIQAEKVHEFQGDIDKYVGDEMMAVFEGERMVSRAVHAAVKIMAKMKAYNSNSPEPLQIGCGINTGEMISGNMGSRERADHTVIGDAVNIGARLCSMANANVILLSEESYREVASEVEVKEHGAVQLKGKKKTIQVYAIRRLLR